VSAKRSRRSTQPLNPTRTQKQGGHDGPGKLEVRTEERLGRRAKLVEPQWRRQRTLCVQAQWLQCKRREREVAVRLVKLALAARVAQQPIAVEPGLGERRAQALQHQP
jgi:hypothetical protein